MRSSGLPNPSPGRSRWRDWDDEWDKDEDDWDDEIWEDE
jgi:hypothetical protein